MGRMKSLGYAYAEYLQDENDPQIDVDQYFEDIIHGEVEIPKWFVEQWLVANPIFASEEFSAEEGYEVIMVNVNHSMERDGETFVFGDVMFGLPNNGRSRISSYGQGPDKPSARQSLIERAIEHLHRDERMSAKMQQQDFVYQAEAKKNAETNFDILNIEYMEDGEETFDYPESMLVPVETRKDDHWTHTKDRIRVKIKSYIRRNFGNDVEVIDFLAFPIGSEYALGQEFNAEYDEEDMVHCNHCSDIVGNEKEVYGDETVDYEMANGELVCIPCHKIWMKEYKNDLDPHYTPFYAETFEADTAADFYRNCNQKGWSVLGRTMHYGCSVFGKVVGGGVVVANSLNFYDKGGRVLRTAGTNNNFPPALELAKVSRELQPDSIDDWSRVAQVANDRLSQNFSAETKSWRIQNRDSSGKFTKGFVEEIDIADFMELEPESIPEISVEMTYTPEQTVDFVNSMINDNDLPTRLIDSSFVNTLQSHVSSADLEMLQALNDAANMAAFEALMDGSAENQQSASRAVFVTDMLMNYKWGQDYWASEWE
ncbi:hypothetical protein OAF79_00605 [Akkermansiaceae bacterium]|nr:hypothetical protein [Akkermansiaceae bacterium]